MGDHVKVHNDEHDLWRELEELMELYFEMDLMATDDSNFSWHRVYYYSLLIVAMFGTLVYAVFMRAVEKNSKMDPVFVSLYRLQATEGIMLVYCGVLSFYFGFNNFLLGASYSGRILCRILISTLVSLYCSFLFSHSVIALTRLLYVLVPLYIYNLPKTILQIALFTGWTVYFAGCFLALYKQESLAILALYDCLGIPGPALLNMEFILGVAVCNNCLTACTYITIILLQYRYKSRVPRNRWLQRNHATLMTCMAHFGMQVFEWLSHWFLHFIRSNNVVENNFILAFTFLAFVRTILTPIVFMALMKKHGQ